MDQVEIGISTLKARELEWLFGSGVWGSAGIYAYELVNCEAFRSPGVPGEAMLTSRDD